MSERIIIESEFKCITPVQLRGSDLDTLGHVNNAVYFNLMDLAKGDYFTLVNGERLDWRKVSVVVANINCDFLKQVLFDEPIVVKTRASMIGTKSFALEQVIVNEETGEVKCHCVSTLVYIEPATLTPEPIPAEWREKLLAYENKNLERHA